MKQEKKAGQSFKPSNGQADLWKKWCDEHKALHNRLDVVEETLDKTVEHLESEVKNLLNLMDGIAWHLASELENPDNLFGDGGKIEMAESCPLQGGELPTDKEEDAGGGDL
ncbi:placenta-specific protein 9 isoform X2 [Monodelphis domestica]|uniref:placenta-specific protein 9 isoform X2 n=1 Tax=Monodelphis domestica TaxID=13616 RepID=UPI00044322C0|nr:placenta-specific protein 9 isoform X2 [Monodelphis domestica]